jgi:hypothetical protein
MFRISQSRKPVVNVDIVAKIDPAVRALGTGCYHVEQIEREPLPSGHTSRRWGVGLKMPVGSVVIERDPCEATC